jgi:hypothetical protein
VGPTSLKDLLDVLQAAGVTHYKDSQLELRLAPRREAVAQVETLPAPKEASPHAQDLAALLRLPDKELLDQMFPDRLPEIYESVEEGGAA